MQGYLAHKKQPSPLKGGSVRRTVSAPFERPADYYLVNFLHFQYKTVNFRHYN